MHKVAILGASGFVGSAIADAFRSQGWDFEPIDMVHQGRRLTGLNIRPRVGLKDERTVAKNHDRRQFW